MSDFFIEDYIPKGYENRVSRNYLHSILHIPDRGIRDAIANAWERGVYIYSDNGGYFRRKGKRDDIHIKAYFAKENARLRSMFHKKQLMMEAYNSIFK